MAVLRASRCAVKTNEKGTAMIRAGQWARVGSAPDRAMCRSMQDSGDGFAQGR